MSAEQDVDKVVLDSFFPPRSWFGINWPRRAGVIVEVGAARPDYLSISAGFRSVGWKVIAVEPNPMFCEAHRRLGFKIHEYACSDEDRDDVDFYVVDSLESEYMGGKVSNESFSSLGIEGKFSDLHETVRNKTVTKKIKVKVRRLDTILSHYEPNLKKIDVLAVDVEGWELKVLDGFSVGRYQPKIIILENLFKEHSYVDKLQSLGYRLWKHIDPNDVYVRAGE